MTYQTSTNMCNFRDTMRFMNALYLTFHNNMATLWPVVQQQAVQQVAVEVQRQVVVETQNQAACFCFESAFVYVYNHMILTTVGLITVYFEYRTGRLIWKTIKFSRSFVWEFFGIMSFILDSVMEVIDWFGLTPKDWVCIILTLVIGTFLCYKIFPFIFRIMDGFNPESDKPETSETREPRKKVDARVRGARGKSPGAKKEK